MLGEDDSYDNGYSKQKLIENEELAWQQGEKLEGAKRSAIEMEGVSMHIMHDLDHQTNQLKIIHSKTNEMSGELEESNSIMGRIMKRENRNKVIIGVFSFIIVLAFILILYFKLAPSSSSSSSTTTNSPPASFL